ncbi:hypothetical protein B0T22DRAFT_447561 [Podospora appendiculata]|uniref:Secreted protein n=1 Tax=Podospora appendiculata TaxID=314037 RepID=A0AAE0XFL6_9PEZI|nr:hypothetical protein B0T22DRAFT_447561 [Podospora appendiculata]
MRHKDAFLSASLIAYLTLGWTLALPAARPPRCRLHLPSVERCLAPLAVLAPTGLNWCGGGLDRFLDRHRQRLHEQCGRHASPTTSNGQCQFVLKLLASSCCHTSHCGVCITP